jgi:starch phosphorylase
MAKASMASILPRFNATRMVDEYVTKFYLSAARRGRHFSQHEHAAASALSGWKARVRAAWDGVKLRRIDVPTSHITFGDRVTIGWASPNGLDASDVIELRV